MCSRSWAIKDMKTRNTFKCYLPQPPWPRQRKQLTTNLGKDVGEGEPSLIHLVWLQTSAIAIEISEQNSQKLKVDLSYNHWHKSKVLDWLVTDPLSVISSAYLLTIARKQTQPIGPLTDDCYMSFKWWMDNKNVVGRNDRIFFRYEEKRHFQVNV